MGVINSVSSLFKKFSHKEAKPIMELVEQNDMFVVICLANKLLLVFEKKFFE
jgi:hypothetical protein